MPAIPTSDLLVITCASGKQVTALLPLLSNWARLRLVAHSPSSASALRDSYPDAEVVTADLAIPTDCHRVISGATCVYHIGPSFHPNETVIGTNMIEAALSLPKSHFRHFVYSSVLHSRLRKLMNHDCKRYVEEALTESSLPYTILQPTHFMDMFPVAKLQSSPDPEVTYTSNWNPDIEFTFVALSDLAAAAKVVLEEQERHFYASYELVGTDKLTYREISGIAGEIIGKKVKVEKREPEEATEALLGMLFAGNEGKIDNRTRDGAERLILYYNRRGLVGNKNVLTWLIGREPMSWRQWAEGKSDVERQKLVGV